MHLFFTLIQQLFLRLYGCNVGELVAFHLQHNGGFDRVTVGAHGDGAGHTDQTLGRGEGIACWAVALIELDPEVP